MENNKTVEYMNNNEGISLFANNFAKTMSVAMPILMLTAVAIRFIAPQLVANYNIWTIAVGTGMLISIVTSIIKSLRK